MPIGTVDYISTAPWNDPFNPWPACSRLTLSATDVNLGEGVMQTLNLIVFDPVGFGVGYAVYSNKPLGEGQQIELELQGTTWAVKYDGDTFYYLPNAARAIPAGKAQGYDWQEDNGGDAASLSIVPVTTWLNPWEHRRRWCLNG
jgi:hypothetical protein